MGSIISHADVRFEVMGDYVMASTEERIIMMKSKAFFTVWELAERNFHGTLDMMLGTSACGLPEVMWASIADENGKELARTF